MVRQNKHSKRIFDASTQQFYHDEFKALPKSLEDSDSLFRDVTCPKYMVPEHVQQTSLPEGVMEGELLDCLLTMDQPLCRSDYFRMMKKLRFMENRQHRLEDNVSEILSLLKDGGASVKVKATKVATQEPTKTVEKFTEIVHAAFARYDFDGSGTINTSEELEQLSLNLVYKLKLRPPTGMDWGVWARGNISQLLKDHGSLEDLRSISKVVMVQQVGVKWAKPATGPWWVATCRLAGRQGILLETGPYLVNIDISGSNRYELTM